MLREIGIVSEIVGDQAIVHTQSQLACSSCHQVETCGNGIIEKYFSGKFFSTQLSNHINAKVGDQVEIQVPKSSVTKASAIVYLIPLIGLISSALIASFIFQDEKIVIFLALSGLILSLFVTKFYNSKMSNNELYSPKMVSVVSAHSAHHKIDNKFDPNEQIKVKQVD